MTEHIYAHEHPESDRVRGGGFTIWFTGLSGAGKTTIAHLVGPALDERGCVVEYLDGDTVRTHLSKGLGFSKEDRDTNIERIGWVASRLTRHGAVVLVSAISPYEETRRHARELVEEHGEFIEVFVKASVESVTAAAAAAAANMPPDFRVSITNAPGKGVYPVSSFTWLLFYEDPKDKAQSKAMVDFMKWALVDGQKYCAELGYAPLPGAVVKLEMTALGKIKTQ